MNYIFLNIQKAIFNWKWLFVFLFLIISSCKTDLSKISSPDNIKDLPQLSITDFRATYKTNSQLKVEAYAPVMNKYTIQDNYVEFPKGVDVKFFDDDYNVSTSLKCKYAINYLQQELWKFSDSVVIVSQKGGQLETQELYFDQKNQKIYSVKYVEVTDPQGTIIRGKGGFESNYDFTIYEFKNVDGVLAVKQEDLE